MTRALGAWSNCLQTTSCAVALQRCEPSIKTKRAEELVSGQLNIKKKKTCDSHAGETLLTPRRHNAKPNAGDAVPAGSMSDSARVSQQTSGRRGLSGPLSKGYSSLPGPRPTEPETKTRRARPGKASNMSGGFGHGLP